MWSITKSNNITNIANYLDKEKTRLALNSFPLLHEVGIVGIFLFCLNLKISLIQLFLASIRIQCTVTNFIFCIELNLAVIDFHVIFIRICTKMPIITGAALARPDFTMYSEYCWAVWENEWKWNSDFANSLYTWFESTPCRKFSKFVLFLSIQVNSDWVLQQWSMKNIFEAYTYDQWILHKNNIAQL